MILGDVCTRRCGFCNVQTGKPTWNDPLEPIRVAASVERMGFKHAVITSVDRDDLPDYGASAFVGVIRSIRMQAPGCKVEVLTPDFRGQEMPLAKVIARAPRRLQPQLRGRPTAISDGATRLEVRALDEGPEDGQGDGRPRRDHEVRSNGRPGRELRRDGRYVRDPPRAPRPGSRSASTSGRPSGTCRSSGTGAGRVSALELAAYGGSASSRSPPDRWSAARATTRTRAPARRHRPMTRSLTSTFRLETAVDRPEQKKRSLKHGTEHHRRAACGRSNMILPDGPSYDERATSSTNNDHRPR